MALLKPHNGLTLHYLSILSVSLGSYECGTVGSIAALQLQVLCRNGAAIYRCPIQAKFYTIEHSVTGIDC